MSVDAARHTRLNETKQLSRLRSVSFLLGVKAARPSKVHGALAVEMQWSGLVLTTVLEAVMN